MPKLHRPAALRLPGYLDAEETAELWGCHPETVKRLVRDGVVPGVKVHGKWLIEEHVARARQAPDLLPKSGRVPALPSAGEGRAVSEHEGALCDTATAAGVIGVNRSTVHRWARVGVLDAIRPADAPPARGGKSRQGPVANRYRPADVAAVARRWRDIRPFANGGKPVPAEVFRDDAALEAWLAERRAQRERWAKPPKPAEPLYFATEAANHLSVSFEGLSQLAALGALTPVPWPNSPARPPRYPVREVRALAEQFYRRGVALPAHLLTTAEAADVVGVSVQSVTRLDRCGLLPNAGRFRGGRVFPRDAAEAIRDAYPRRGITSKVARDIVRRVQAGEKPDDVAGDLGLKRERVKAIAGGGSWRWATADLLPKRKKRAA